MYFPPICSPNACSKATKLNRNVWYKAEIQRMSHSNKNSLMTPISPNWMITNYNPKKKTACIPNRNRRVIPVLNKIARGIRCRSLFFTLMQASQWNILEKSRTMKRLATGTFNLSLKTVKAKQVSKMAYFNFSTISLHSSSVTFPKKITLEVFINTRLIAKQKLPIIKTHVLFVVAAIR